MSLRQLVEGDCGGVNPLMQLGGQFTRDAARKDEGFARAQFERGMRQEEQMVNEFLGQIAAPPQSFQMETLLQEMREIEQANGANPQMLNAPRVIDEVTRAQSAGWAKEFGTIDGGFGSQEMMPRVNMLNVQPQQQQMVHVNEFFDELSQESGTFTNQRFPAPAPYLAICPPFQPVADFFDGTADLTAKQQIKAEPGKTMEDWIDDYQNNKAENEQSTASYNEKFWQRLQDEWQKLSEDTDHPWLSDLNENYDPYKEYVFAEENTMSKLDNAFEKGKEYLAKGDIPSAVLCFEAAAKKEPENAEIWEHLGLSQAENEMDPQSIAALKRSLDIKPDNMRVLMALAVCYTNESLQSHALKMLTNWLQINPKYKHLQEQHPELQEGGVMASSLIRGNKLQGVQNLFLEAVRQQPQEIDSEVQEALGVLYNLSSEFDKAVDCFRAALHVNPQNAKVWNRLGASLANGSRSVEAVEAYQHALALEPGFIRVRYNVGVCCMNLKAYKEAVEHLLTALNMQANSAAMHELPDEAGAAAAAVVGGQQQMSESIWSTLKMIISLMGRSELQGYVNDRNLKALNEAFKE